MYYTRIQTNTMFLKFLFDEIYFSKDFITLKQIDTKK